MNKCWCTCNTVSSISNVRDNKKIFLGAFVLRLLRDIVKRHAPELSSGAFVHVYSLIVVAWCRRRRSLHIKLVATFTNTPVAEQIKTAARSTSNMFRPHVDFVVSLWSTELRRSVHLVEDGHFLSTHHHRHLVHVYTVRAAVPDLAGARPGSPSLVDRSSMGENQRRFYRIERFAYGTVGQHSAVTARCL